MNFSKFEEKIGIKFKDKNLLKQAFTHRSYLNENPSLALGTKRTVRVSGRRYSEMAITEYLYKNIPKNGRGNDGLKSGVG